MNVRFANQNLDPEENSTYTSKEFMTKSNILNETFDN